MYALLAVLASLTVGIPAVARAEDPVRLTDQHVDLRITFDPGTTNVLDVVAADDDSRPPRFLAATNCVLIVPESARLELPADYPPLGGAGDSLWVLPASQQAGVLYLGMSGESLPAGIFAGAVGLRLTAVAGPGQFLAWQADLSGLSVLLNSRDGLGADDVFPILAGGHSHVNWGFTTSGVYRVTFQAEGRRIGETTNVVSPPRTFTFEVQPLPPETASPYQRWQESHWPGVVDVATIGPAADPDGDGILNLWEYLLGTDPRTPEPASRASGTLRARVEGEGASAGMIVTLMHAAAATDVELELQTAHQPGGPWAASAAKPVVGAPADGRVGVTWTDPRPVASALGSFYRIAARWLGAGSANVSKLTN